MEKEKWLKEETPSGRVSVSLIGLMNLSVISRRIPEADQSENSDSESELQNRLINKVYCFLGLLVVNYYHCSL